MKILFIILCSFFSITALAQQKTFGKLDATMKTDTLEVACGMCKYEMKGEDCALAVRTAGKTYYVKGPHIDGFGDAHATDGFCNAVRKAALQGRVVNNEYVASYMKLLP